VVTDQPKLQATFVYENSKVEMKKILEALGGVYGGRYQATVVKESQSR
jgi:hypothetical protein